MSTPAPAAPVAATPKATASQSNGTPPPAAAPTPVEIRKMKVKLDGKEVEVPESEVLAGYQQGKVAHQRFQEAAQLRKEAEQILQFAKANPTEFFEKTGLNAREWAEKYLIQELEREAMSPEQKKARENEEKLRKFEDDGKKAKEKEEQAYREKLTAEHRNRLDLMFTEALHKSGLPKTPYTVKRMAELQLINIKNKYELGADQLAKLVREDYASEQKSLLGAFDGDQLMEFLGPDLVKKLSKAQIAKLKARGVTPSASTPQRKTSDQPTGMTWREYQKKNRKIGP